MKKILITGKGSYVGQAVERWLNDHNGKNGGEVLYSVTTLDMLDEKWRDFDFNGFDVVFHVAGIAHDTGNKKNAELYYKVNRDLAIEVAEKAKESGVKQFIFMSSMLVYNGCKEKTITAQTQPKVRGCYGDSKLQADIALQKMNAGHFKVVVIRPPMIFGKNCKGNFPLLVKLVLNAPFFPKIKNQRSMLHIDNLCEFVRITIKNEASGLFFPQNPEYFCISELAKQIAALKGRQLRITGFFNWAVWLAYPFLSSIRKLFGNLIYDKKISAYFDDTYQIVGNYESVKRSLS